MYEQVNYTVKTYVKFMFLTNHSGDKTWCVKDSLPLEGLFRGCQNLAFHILSGTASVASAGTATPEAFFLILQLAM